MNRAVLIVSSNDDVAIPLWHAFERAGVRAEIALQGPPAYEGLGNRVFSDRNCSWGVVVDAVRGDTRTFEFIQTLRTTTPDLFILAALAAPNVRLTQAVTEAGAWDYLIHPFDSEQIENCLRMWTQRASSQLGRQVCFLPARAGDGASTIALHVAQAAARERRSRGLPRKVLLIDLDFQSGELAFRLQLESQRDLGQALQPDAADLRWSDLVSPWQDVDVLCAPRGRDALRPQSLERLPALFAAAREAYPFVVTDMPPAVHSSARDVLSRANEIYVVCTPEMASLHLARRRLQELDNIGVAQSNVKLVLNRAGTHRWIGLEEATHVTGMPITTMLRNDYLGLHRATMQGGTIAPRSPLGRELEDLGRLALGTRVAAAA